MTSRSRGARHSTGAIKTLQANAHQFLWKAHVGDRALVVFEASLLTYLRPFMALALVSMVSSEANYNAARMLTAISGRIQADDLYQNVVGVDSRHKWFCGSSNGRNVKTTGENISHAFWYVMGK